MVHSYSLASSIRSCQDLTRVSGSNFTPAFALLPPEKREAMQILYAYTRYTDDLADRPEILSKNTPEQKRQKVNQWRDVLTTVLGTVDKPDGKVFAELEKGFPGCDGLPLLPALKMIVEKFRMPCEPLFQLIDGVEADIEPRRPAQFEDVARYCHQVATSVGMVSLAIWGTTQPLHSDEVNRAAQATGIAFQLTNILRDLREDFREGRLYLPQDELAHSGFTENEFGSLLFRNSLDSPLRNFLSKQFDRLEAFYADSAPLYQMISSDSRRVFGMMWSRYYRIAQKMIARPDRVISPHRIRLTPFEKLRLYLRWRFFAPNRLRS